MPEDILNPDYWSGRLRGASLRHMAVFRTTPDNWLAIERRHREILGRLIKPSDSVLDIGCGWGRLLGMLPEGWDGDYLGVDLCPEFVAIAQREHPGFAFVAGDATEFLSRAPVETDWAVMISIRPMILRNLGEEYWRSLECVVSRCAKRLLYLECDVNDEGSVE